MERIQKTLTSMKVMEKAEFNASLLELDQDFTYIVAQNEYFNNVLKEQKAESDEFQEKIIAQNLKLNEQLR